MTGAKLFKLPVFYVITVSGRGSIHLRTPPRVRVGQFVSVHIEAVDAHFKK